MRISPKKLILLQNDVKNKYFIAIPINHNFLSLLIDAIDSVNDKIGFKNLQPTNILFR